MSTWTDERLERAKRMWQDGHSASMIAAVLGGGLTRNAVCGMASRKKWFELPRGPRQGLPTGRPRGIASVHRGTNGGLASKVLLAVKHPPKPVAARPVAARAAKLAAEPAGKHAVALMALLPRQCRWPVGEATGETQMFCGEAVTTGLDAHGQEIVCSYCAWHEQRAHLSPSSRTAITLAGLARGARLAR